AEGLAEFLDRLIHPPFGRQRVAEVGTGHSVVRPEAEGLTELLDGLVHLLLIPQGDAEVEMRTGTLRAKGHRSRVEAKGLVQLGRFQAPQAGAQLVVDPEVAGMLPLRLPQQGYRLLGSARVPEENSKMTRRVWQHAGAPGGDRLLRR